LEIAARSLASNASAVAIVTGFCIPDGGQPAAETDGPPGALYLARALGELGIDVVLITDRYGRPVLEAGCRLWGLPSMVREFPFETGPPDAPERLSNAAVHCIHSDRWIESFLSDSAFRATHVIAIERVGPSHTRASLAAQWRDGPAPLALFEREVPPEHRDVSHNMRGEIVQGYAAKIHRLFETIHQRRLPITTLGLADGGNEIGMGCIPWETLRQALDPSVGARIACRIKTDHFLLAGVSNWAAYALGAAVSALRGRQDLVAGWGSADQWRLIEHLVREAGAIDGVTRRREPTVDGLPPQVYWQTFDDIRALCS
jgi:D-glutamate cyclase